MLHLISSVIDGVRNPSPHHLDFTKPILLLRVFILETLEIHITCLASDK